MEEEKLAYRSPEPESNNGSKKVWIVVAVLVIIAIIVLFFVFRSKTVNDVDGLTEEEKAQLEKDLFAPIPEEEQLTEEEQRSIENQLFN